MADLNDLYETHDFDVIVIGAGGAGLRAAIASAQAGCRTAVICKSLLGKAHTVMAEGGVAASLGNVDPEDGWKTHFSDTMKGGKGLNNWRMAEIFAKEAGDRVLELERWGAVFDRTPVWATSTSGRSALTPTGASATSVTAPGWRSSAASRTRASTPASTSSWSTP